MKNCIVSLIFLLFIVQVNGQYCSAGPSSTFDSNVESVSITGENNTNINYIGCPGVTGVEDQTALIVDLTAGSSYSLNVQFGTCGGNYSSAGEAWIDWNQNTIFESTESIGTWSGTPPTSASTFNFIVPPTAFTGLANIRVMQYESGTLPLNPCATFTWGSVVDFSANVSGGYIPTCPAPPVQFMSVINITATNATLQWVAGGLENQWNIEYGLSGFINGSGTSFLDTLNSTIIGGLSPQTNYEFYVQAICGAADTSLWSGPFSFTTPCAALVPPHIEDFSSGFPPNACWEQASDGDPASGPTTIGTSSWINDGFGNIGNNGAVKINLYSTFTHDWIFTPQFDFTTGGPFQVEFDLGVFGWNQTTPAQLGSDDRVELLISTDGGITWIGLTNWNSSYITGPNGNHEIVPVPSFSGNIVQFAIWASEGTIDDPEDVDVMIDNFAVYTIPSCPQPLYINSYDIGPDSASLTWTNFASDSAWVAYLTPNGTPPDTSYQQIIYNDSVTFSGLNANTPYDFYIQSICSLGDTSFLTGPYTFFTTCLAVGAPYFQDFDNTTAPYIDQCWSVINNTGNSFANISADNSSFNPQRSAPNSIGFYNSGADTGKLILVSPEILDLDTTKRIRFYMQNEGSTSYTSDLVVGTMSDPNDVTTFTPFSTVFNNAYNSSNWQEIIVSFNSYFGSDHYIALAHGLNSTYDYMWMDDFHYENIPSCIAPTNLIVSNITSDSAVINWNPGGNETNWSIQWGPSGFTLGTGIIDSVNTTSYNLSALNPSFGYDFYVQAICAVNDSSYWAGPINFNTLLQGPAGVTCVSGNPGNILFDDLESTGGWTGINGSMINNGAWNINSSGTSSTGTGPNGAHSGNNYFYYETSGTNPTSGSIVSPLIDLANANDDVELSFWMHAYGQEVGVLTIGVGNSVTGPFSPVFSSSGEIQTSNGDPFQNVGVNLSSFLGQQIYLEFAYTSGSSYTGDLAIDLIEIESCISCPSPVPTSLNINNISSDSVNLNWQAGGNENNWLVYLIPDTSNFSNTSPFLVSNDTVDLPVNPNSTYSFYVQSICTGGDTSVLAGPLVFNTPCVSFTTFPYIEDFSSWPPTCWDLTGGSQTCVHYNNAAAQASFWSWSSGQNALMTSPVFDVSSLVSPELIFDWSHQFNTSYPNDALEVLVSDDGGTTWNQIWYKAGSDLESNDGASTTTAGSFVSSGRINISNFGTSVMVMFNFSSGYGPHCFIDNVEIKEAPMNDIGVADADVPFATTGCDMDSSSVVVTIQNFGFAPQTGFNVEYTLNTVPVVETVFDTIQGGSSLIYSFSNPIDLSADGVYDFTFTTSLPNDSDISNDAFGSLSFENFYTPIAPSTNNDTVCVYDSIATLTATGPSGVTIDWFDSIGGNIIASGDTLVTPAITTTTSFWAAYKDMNPGNMGAVDNTIGSGGGYNFFNEGLVFEVTNPITLDSVTVYPTDTGFVEVTIGNIIGANLFNDTYHITDPITGNGAVKIPIGIVIQPGFSYTMTAGNATTTGGLYRNTNGASYPYNFGSDAAITGPTNGQNAFYFFFYNWDISTVSCYSDPEEAIAVVSPCTNIKEISNIDFDVIPNPNNGTFQIVLNDDFNQNTTVSVRDISGKVILEEIVDNNNYQVNLNNIEKGVYIVCLDNNQFKTQKRIIVQ